MAARNKIASTRELRRFGLVLGAMLALVFGTLSPWLKHRPVRLWPFLVAGGLWVLAILAPRGLALPYRAFAKAGATLTKLLSYAALTVIFYVIITPLSFLLRVLGRDALALKRNPKALSYRVRCDRAAAARFDVPF